MTVVEYELLVKLKKELEDEITSLSKDAEFDYYYERMDISGYLAEIDKIQARLDVVEGWLKAEEKEAKKNE